MGEDVLTTSADVTLDPAVGGAIMAGIAVMWVAVLVFYIWMALCLYKIAKRTNTENAWFAWIPILNVVLMITIARKPIWWIILMMIPFVNIIVGIIVWVEMLKVLNKPTWWVILMMIPGVNLIMFGVLAFGK